MSGIAEVFLRKAAESLDGAESEIVNGRYNNVANRAYDASFQAAVAALDAADVRPPGSKGQRGHEFVQGQVNGLLINRRKLYPALRGTRPHLLLLRQQADYEIADVSELQAYRLLAHARVFVAAVTARVEGGSTAWQTTPAGWTK